MSLLDLRGQPAEDRKKATTMELVNAPEGGSAEGAGTGLGSQACYSGSRAATQVAASLRYLTYNRSLVIWAPTSTLVSTVK